MAAMTRQEKARHRIEARVYANAIGVQPMTKVELLVALLTEKGFAARVLRKRLGLPFWLHVEDRRVLEQVIFPYYRAMSSIKTVLFVGCDSYTAYYERSHFSNTNYWTIEPDPKHKKFGAKQHLVVPMEELGRNFDAEYFDLIVCNGVYGFGLDTAPQCEAAFSQCYQCLAKGGHFLFGWDDLPGRDPAPLAELRSLGLFRKNSDNPLGTWHYCTDTPYRHTFDFYQK